MSSPITVFALALVFALRVQASHAQEITVHALNGKTGKPIAGEHLLVFAGVDEKELRSHARHFDLQTDEKGIAILHLDDASVSILQVWVDHHHLCVQSPNYFDYSLAAILKSGAIGDNNCGNATGSLQPGALFVFAREANLPEKMQR